MKIKRDCASTQSRQTKHLIFVPNFSNLNPLKFMKKNRKNYERIPLRFLSKKTIRVMKLSLFLSVLTVFQLLATESYSQLAKITLKLDDVKISDALVEIENQSEFYFLYSPKLIDVDRRVNIEAEKEPIKEILQGIFGEDVKVYVLDKQIILTQAEVNKVSDNSMQQVKITGTVKNKAGAPLPGVSVVAKGTTVGTITSIDGSFSVVLPSSATTLNFSFIGMDPQEVTIGNQTIINVVLEESSISLDEVVVVGYGTQKKSDLTGSITSIKAKDIVQMPTQRVDQALQGRTSGVLVLNTDGAPGGNVTVRIRGMNSILGGNQALIVVDGVQGVNLNTINPNDIESMEVLKDASATAIYGSRGANGVILVTTKRGATGKPTLAFSMNLGAQTILNKQKCMTASQYATAINDDRATKNLAGTPTPIFTPGQIAEFEENGGTDWQDVLFQVAPIQNYNLSASGGINGLKYFISGGYLDQDGTFVNTGFKRYSIRSNISLDINKWLNTELTWNGVMSKRAGTDGNPLGALFWGATEDVYDDQGNYTVHPDNYGIPQVWNPLAEAIENDITRAITENFINASLNFKIIEGLTLKIAGIATLSNSKNDAFYNSKSFVGRPQSGKVGAAYLDYNDFQRIQNTNILTYDKRLNEHHLNISLVAEQQKESYYRSGTTATKFSTDALGVNDLAGASEYFISSDSYTRTLNSFLGRINYSFKNKYLLTASYRADGSSVFGENNKWGYFPSISLAWRLSEESFIKDLDLFSELKLRGSIGSTGNQGISPYQTLASIRSISNYPWMGGSTTNQGYGYTNPANPDLKWETTTQSNIGLDFGMFKGRLIATFDIYKKVTTDLLMLRELPTSSGFSTITDNVGSMENKGLEVSLGGDPLVGNFRWNTGFNISFNRNTVLDIGDNDKIRFITTNGGYGVNGGLMYMVKNEPMGQMYGWSYMGTWKESERENAAVYGQLPGDARYSDTNKDGTVDSQDIHVIGNSIPKFFYGWTNKFFYKNFDLTIFVQGASKYNIFNQSRIYFDGQGTGNSERLVNRWTIDNQDTDVPAFIDMQTRVNAGLTNKVFVDQRISRWVEDASYFRLKNIVLAYTIPVAATSKAGIGSARVFISGTNLFTITKYSGYDPEASSYNNNDGQIGVDQGSYPSAKTYTFGIDVTF